MAQRRGARPRKEAPMSNGRHSYPLSAAHLADLAARFGTPTGRGCAIAVRAGRCSWSVSGNFRPVTSPAGPGGCASRRWIETEWTYRSCASRRRCLPISGRRRRGSSARACFNNAAREICARAPRRLKSLCQVPLQDSDLACRELSRAMAEGHVGVHIGNHVGARDINDEGIITFLQHCAAEGAAVFVHPWDMMAQDRMSKYQLPWLVAMPAETQLSILWLILSGAFERLPRSLKLCFATRRRQLCVPSRACRQRVAQPRCRARGLPASAVHYVDRFHVDAAVFSGDALAFLVKIMGEDRVMLGSDYPSRSGSKQVGSLIRSHETLSMPSREKLLQANATAFFGLDAGRSALSGAAAARRSA